MKDTKCEHLEKKPKQDGFHYPLSETEMLWLCNECEDNLRKEILEQIAAEIGLKLESLKRQKK